jgi:hypothetical protein
MTTRLAHARTRKIHASPDSPPPPQRLIPQELAFVEGRRSAARASSNRVSLHDSFYSCIREWVAGPSGLARKSPEP